jgi:hypothetical protein
LTKSGQQLNGHRLVGHGASLCQIDIIL